MSSVAFSVAMAAMVAGASAFVAPSAFMGSRMVSSPVSAVTTKMSAEALIGADVETGGIFDPLGFAKKEGELERFRAAELKHGRVAMLAVLGFWTQSLGIHLPDPVFSESKPIDAFFKVVEERPLAAIQVLLAIAWVETAVSKNDEGKPAGDVGNFGDNFKPSDPTEYAELQLKELKNGRLAMVASIAILVQELITGQSVFGQLAAGHVSPFGDGQGAF